MDYHKVDFPQALKDLADRYQVSLPEKPLTPFEREKMELKDLLFKLNGMAAEYFHRILTRSEKGGPVGPILTSDLSPRRPSWNSAWVMRRMSGMVW
jgi:DNA primase